MMFKSAPQSDLNGFLDAGSHIRGELHFEDTFRIDGKVTGKVVSDGELVVGEKGEVDGEIDVRMVYVSGHVKGAIRARERLEITSTGRIQADLETPALAIEEGAYFEGRCAMGRPSKAQSPEAAEKVRTLPVARP